MNFFGQKWLYSGKSGSIRTKVVVFRQSSCIWAKVVVIGQRWIYSAKSGSTRAKVVVFGQKWFYSGRSYCSDWVCTAVMSNDVMKDLRG